MQQSWQREGYAALIARRARANKGNISSVSTTIAAHCSHLYLFQSSSCNSARVDDPSQSSSIPTLHSRTRHLNIIALISISSSQPAAIARAQSIHLNVLGSSSIPTLHSRISHLDLFFSVATIATFNPFSQRCNLGLGAGRAHQPRVFATHKGNHWGHNLTPYQFG